MLPNCAPVNFVTGFCFVLLAQCKSVPETGLLKKDDPPLVKPDTPGNMPLVTVIPPMEWQIGGKDLFSDLIPIQVMDRSKKYANGDRVYVNQTLDLEKLGPGSNVFFVVENSLKNWAFAFSNGRFDEIESVGSLDNQSFPNQKPERDGKYPYPRDRAQQFLPADKLLTSNGPHGTLQKVLIDFTGSDLESDHMAGHLGIDKDGNLYIGYISGRVNRSAEFGEERRALSSWQRPAFHQALSKAFLSLQIKNLLDLAPTKLDEILSQEAVRYYPSQGVGIDHFLTVNSYYQLLRRTLTDQEMIAYLEKLPPENTLTLFSHHKRTVLAAEHLSFLIDAESILERERKFIEEKYGLSIEPFDGQNQILMKVIAAEPSSISRKELVELVTQRNVDPNFKDGYGYSPLHQATMVGDPDVLEILLKLGGDPNAEINNGKRPIHFAALGENADVLRVLLTNGADPNPADGKIAAPLHFATSGQNTSMVRLLLDAGADPNRADENHQTPIFKAADVEILKDLVKHGADIDHQSRSGETALHRSITFGNIRKVKFLLDQEAEPNTRTSNDRTPLADAIQRGQIEIVKLLLERGADPNAPSLDNPPLEIAISWNRLEMVDLLLAHGAKSDPIDQRLEDFPDVDLRVPCERLSSVDR